MGYQIRAVAIVLALVFIVNRVISNIRIARFKKQHGCKPEVRIPQSERIVGYGLYKIQIAASKTRTILPVSLKRFEDNGNTWKATMMGRVSPRSHIFKANGQAHVSKSFYNTIDPENIKSILATNFKDFNLGQRQESFGPLLGQGIFTTGQL